MNRWSLRVPLFFVMCAVAGCDSEGGGGNGLGAGFPGTETGGSTPMGSDASLQTSWLYNRGNGGIALRFRDNGEFQERRYVELAGGAIGVEDYSGTFTASGGTLTRVIKTSTCLASHAGGLPETKANQYHIKDGTLTISNAVYVKTGFSSFTNMKMGCVSTTNGTFTPM